MPTPEDLHKEETELSKARKQIVAQRSDLVQYSRNGFTRLEKNAIRYMVSKVKPTDHENQEYVFSFREFSMLMKYKTDSYTDIKTLLQTIRDKSWWRNADNPDEDDVLMGWLNIVHINERKGTATITFHPDVFPYILRLQEQYEKDGAHYVQYMIQNVSLMRGPYSADLYEILKSYANNKTWTFEIGTGSKRDIQRRLATPDTKTGEPIIPETWKNWAIFERNVLKPSKREINLYSDIVIDYVPSKIDFNGVKHRRYVCVEFQIDKKTAVEQENTDSVIDAEYREIEDSSKYKQMTIQDVFYESRRSAKEEEKDIAEDLKEIEIQSYRYPIFKDSLPDFSNEELDALYHEATKHIEAGKIQLQYREMWVTDYVTHYYDMVIATINDTKTTPYKRLLNMVRKDYDEFASQITAYDVPTEDNIDTTSLEQMTIEEMQRRIIELQKALDQRKGEQ